MLPITCLTLSANPENKKTLHLRGSGVLHALVTFLLSLNRRSQNMSNTKSTPMTPSAAARIQSAAAKANGGQVTKGSFAARAQAAAAKNGK